MREWNPQPCNVHEWTTVLLSPYRCFKYKGWCVCFQCIRFNFLSKCLLRNPSSADISHCHSFPLTTPIFRPFSFNIYLRLLSIRVVCNPPHQSTSEGGWGKIKIKNKYFLLKWRHVNHQATPGLLSLSQPSLKSVTLYTPFYFGEGRWAVVVDVSNLINNILFLADVKIISSRRQQMLLLAFCRRVWPDPKKRPLLRPFSLCNVNLYFSSHRKSFSARAKADFGSWDVLEYNAISRW